MDGVGGISLDPRPLTLLARLLLERRSIDARPVARAADMLDEPECWEILLVERIFGGRGGSGGASKKCRFVGEPTDDERFRRSASCISSVDQ